MVEMSTAVERTNDIPGPHKNSCENIKDLKDTDPVITNGSGTENSEPITPPQLPTVQYSREDMLVLERADLALLRPECLDTIFDREGRWDPMAWHCGQPTGEAETPPVGTLEFRKRTRSNAADKDVDVILSPQRMSFGNGCAGSKVPPTSDNSNSNTKRLNGLLPKTKFDKNSERTRDPDREKHLQKMNGNSVNREQIRKAIRDLHENRDRNKDGSAPTKEEEEMWLRNSDYSSEFRPEYNKTYKDTKYNNSSSNGMFDRTSKRNWNPRRNSERSVDDEPEWFTSGPTSRLDTIELKGFEDDDKLHSTEAAQNKDDSSSKGRDDELAMDPLGNPEMTSTSNQYANESNYSTGLQEDWDPTHPKFNVDALLDPDAFVEGGKDLLEAEKSINMPNPRGVPMPLEFWSGTHNTSSPKEFQGAPGQPRQESNSPSHPTKEGPGYITGMKYPDPRSRAEPNAMGIHPGHHGSAPPTGHPMFDARNGRTMEDDPIIRQLLQNNEKPPNLKPGVEMLMRPDLLAHAQNLPRNVRDMLLQRSQSEHLPPPGPMLPHPGPVHTPRHPIPEHIMRDPRLIDPRVVDPRFNLPSPIQQHFGKQGPMGPNPRNGQDLLSAVKNDPAQLDKVIHCLQNTLKLGNAPPESKPTMHALLRDMEKAKSEHIQKLHRLQLLASAQHQLQKHPDQISKVNAKRHSYDLPQPSQQQLIQALHLQNLHDKTLALKQLLRMPEQGPPLMTAPARMAPVPHKVAGPAFVRPRITGEESIPTRITGHHGDHRMMMGNKLPHGFPMAFTPTSVMIKSSESRNFGHGKMEGDLDHNINLTPSHVQPSPQGPHPGHHPRMQYRPQDGHGMPNGRRSPRFDDVPKPVPTIETSRGGVPKLHFPPSAFSAPMKGMPPPPPNFMMHQALAKGIPPSPHGAHIPNQLLMQELMHSNKPSPSFNHPIPPGSIPNSNAPTF
ncbi:hypothetical protein ACHWQZ_G011379 [Mnemiopsis leidyi]